MWYLLLREESAPTAWAKRVAQQPMSEMAVDGHRLVFIGGLHRSGTTPMARCLAEHPQVSGFAGTGVKEDEGQHLQTVYPSAREHGGAGHFAVAEAAHLTEESALATEANARRLFEQWQPHWDLARPVLIEKSPPNLVMTRFLQSLFPDARFLIVVRHPVVVSLSTMKWVDDSLETLLEAWFHAHDVFVGDAARLHRVQVVKYEDFVSDTVRTLSDVAGFLDLTGDVPAGSVAQDRSDGYVDQWHQLKTAKAPWRRARYQRLCDRFENRANAYGYSLLDLKRRGPFPEIG